MRQLTAVKEWGYENGRQIRFVAADSRTTLVRMTLLLAVGILRREKGARGLELG